MIISSHSHLFESPSHSPPSAGLSRRIPMMSRSVTVQRDKMIPGTSLVDDLVFELSTILIRNEAAFTDGDLIVGIPLWDSCVSDASDPRGSRGQELELFIPLPRLIVLRDSYTDNTRLNWSRCGFELCRFLIHRVCAAGDTGSLLATVTVTANVQRSEQSRDWLDNLV